MIERLQKILGFWANLHPLLRFFIGVVLLIGAGWGIGRPAYREGKHWWYGLQLQTAEKAMQEGDMQKARDLSQIILRKDASRDLEAIRVLERSLSALRDPSRINVANAMVFHKRGNQEDRLKGFLLHIEGSPLGWLGLVWTSMEEKYHKDRRFALPFAERLLDQGKYLEALSLVQSLENWDKQWDTQRLALKILITADQTDTLTQAQQKLEEWWPADQHESAMELWESIPILKLNATLMQKSIARLNTSVPRDALMLARLHYVNNQWQRIEIVEQVISQWKKKVAPLELAKFVYDIGLNYHLFAAFPAEEAATIDGMIPLQLQACAKENEWEMALKYLNAGKDKMDKAIFWGWKAAIAEKMDSNTDLAGAISELNSNAPTSSDLNIYLRIAKIMRLVNLPERVNDYTLQAISNRRGALPLFADITFLIESLYNKGLEKTFFEVIAIYSNFEPTNPILAMHSRYLACMAKSCDSETLLKVMKPLSDTYKESPQLRAVMSAIYLSLKDFASAKEQVEVIKDDLKILTPGHYAAVVVARYKSGLIPLDDPLIRDMPWSKMMPVEASFYRGFFDDDTIKQKASTKDDKAPTKGENDSTKGENDSIKGENDSTKSENDPTK